MKRSHPISKIGLYVSEFGDLTPSDSVFLTLCRTECDMLIVLMPTDYSLRLQKKKSAYSTDERSFRVGSLTVVNFVSHYDEESPSLGIDKINPDFIFYGRNPYDIEEYSEILQKDKLRKIDYPWGEESSGHFFQIPSELTK